MEFMPDVNKMYCMYCGASYSVEEYHAMEGKKSGEESPEPEMDEWEQEEGKKEERRQASIKMQILHCNSCGAELAVNGVEASSFCAYCGQATVVMDRVDDYLQPDYILPFKVTRDQAEHIIRNKIEAGAFIPEGIKHFEVEKLRGIYVPFWLFDIFYGDDQYWKYTVKQGKSSVTRYCHRLGECHFQKMTLDASQNLNDDSSQRLEPYDVKELQPFDAAYLSGFYSDRFDVGTEDLVGLSYQRAKVLFDEEVKKTVKHSGAKLHYSSPVHAVTKQEYALLPVWFLTFRYENMPYTILVNGQTRKMVGAVPYVKKKAFALFAGMAALFCVVFSILGAFLTPIVLSLDSEDSGKAIAGYFMIIGAAIITTWSTAIAQYRALNTSIALTRSGITSRFVKERQGNSWEG